MNRKALVVAVVAGLSLVVWLWWGGTASPDSQEGTSAPKQVATSGPDTSGPPATGEGSRPRADGTTPPLSERRREALATLEGSTLERASQAPLPLVELTLTSRASQAERHATSSDEHGRFRFEGLVPGEYQLEARAPGYAPRKLSRVHVPSSGVTVALEGSAFLEGFVHLPDGAPAAGARVSATGAEEVVETETSAGGGFSLDVPPGRYQVTARLGDRTGAASGRVVVGAGMTVKDLHIRLGTAASIAGLVRRKGSGEPIADAALTLHPNDGGGELAQVRTTAEGRFEAEGLSPGAYDVGIRARGFKAQRRFGITVLEGQRFELLVELDAHGRIEGTVVDGEEKPLAGIEVSPQWKWRPMEDARSTVTDAAGRFVLEDVTPGDVYVAARRPGSTDFVRELVKLEPGGTGRVRLRLSGEGMLEGTVRLTGGRVPPRPVTVYAQRVGAPRFEALEVPASAEGTWSMRVRAGRYQLSAWMVDVQGLSDNQEKVVDLKPGTTSHVELEVREGQKPIVVTVLEPNGAPSVRATVMGSEAGKTNILLEQQTDESGRVTVLADSLGSDSLRLWAENGGRRGELPSVPTTRTAVTLQLSPGARLTGSVRSAGGRAVNGFGLVVSPVRTDEDYFTQRTLEFTGDEFVVEDVSPGRQALTATLPDGRSGKVEVSTPSGQTTRVDVVVDAGGGLTGRLLDAKTGEPLLDAFVEVDGLRSPMTGADGRFRMEDLAPGAHRVTAWSRGYDITDKQVTLTSGKTVDVGEWRLGAPRVEPGRLGLTFGMSGKDVLISGMSAGVETGELRVGDVVTAIDGATVLDAGEARQRELGAPGSQAVLSIRRDGQPWQLVLTRAR